jgi:hypothetical protein
MSYSVAKAWRLDFSGRGCSAASYCQLQLLGCGICTQLYVISLINEIINDGPGKYSNSVSLWYTNGFSSLEEVTLCRFYQRQWKDRGRNQRGEVTRESGPCLPCVFLVMTVGSVHSYYIAAAGNAISSQLSSPCIGRRYGPARQAYGPIHASSPGHAKLVRTMCWASPP